MKQFIALVVVVSFCQTASAQNQYGIQLNPGERLVSVNGIPVTATSAVPRATNNQPTTVQRPTINYGGSMYSGTDQQRAQAEANYMARTGNRGHVGGQIGMFEGCGWSTGGTPSTCTPSRPMRLTADAIARGPGGLYRVRAWR